MRNQTELAVLATTFALYADDYDTTPFTFSEAALEAAREIDEKIDEIVAASMSIYSLEAQLNAELADLRHKHSATGADDTESRYCINAEAVRRYES